ncbi:hypothetical protein AHAS_Ahas03G0339900 [Arachis hypogaea]
MQKAVGGLIIIIALLTVVGVGRCQRSASDADVLRILKTTINAPMSFQWTDPDVCKWRRIQCDSAKRVTAIQIGNQNLQGTLPKELEKLSALQNLECQGNSLTGSFPYLPKSVQKLIIHDNKFNSIPNGIFKGLGLIFLGLSGNSLEGPLPPSLGSSSIETVLVNGNSRLNGTISVLKTMTSLKQFWAHGNAFTGPIPDMSNHNHLYDMNLRDNQLTGVIPLSLTTLPSLEVVNLTNNLFQGSPPKFKDGVGVDNYLDKGRNQYCTPIPGEPCSSVVNALLSAIEPLGYPLIFAKTWWGNDPCGNKWLGIICSGGNISVVNFQGMGLSGAISPSFASLTSVTKLVLSNNNFTSKIPTELTTMPHLQELDVSNNNLYGILIYMFLCRKKPKHARKFQHPTAIVIHPNQSSDRNAILKIASAGVHGGGAEVFSPSSNAYQVESSGNLLISIDVLKAVTNNFAEENVLGKGGFGTVYKGKLHDGTRIAVKRMQSGIVAEKGVDEFMAETAVVTI